MLQNLEAAFEKTLFASRWLMAPFYFGLVLSLGVLLLKFAQEFWQFAAQSMAAKDTDIILGILTLIDLSLAGNLLLIVIFSGYENFVSKMHVGDHIDRPEWMGTVDFSGLKLKLVASIVAISGIHLLKAFMNVGKVSKEELMWLVIIHLTFVISGLLLAWMDRISGEAKASKAMAKS